MGQILTVEQMTWKKRSRIIRDGAQAQFDTGIMFLFHKSGVLSFESWGDEWIAQLAECCRQNPVILFGLQAACGEAANFLLAEAQTAPKQEDEPGEASGNEKDM